MKYVSQDDHSNRTPHTHDSWGTTGTLSPFWFQWDAFPPAGAALASASPPIGLPNAATEKEVSPRKILKIHFYRYIILCTRISDPPKAAQVSRHPRGSRGSVPPAHPAVSVCIM